jgi:effector protein SdbA
MHQKRNYYILEKAPSSIWSIPLSILQIPFSLPKWIVSFFLSRNFTHIALNPTQIKTQKPIHLVFVSNEKDEKGTVIINTLPHESHKTINDYLLKFSSSIINLPYISTILKRTLSYDNPEDKAYIDKVLEEIDLLLEGKSQRDKCAGKIFSMDDLHFKGLESLDSRLHTYFYDQLYKKYGKEVVDKPRPIQLEFYSLQTPDKAVLDSVEVTTEDERRKPYSERKFVVSCMARDQNYINWIKDFNYSANKIGCTVIGFNYRGVDYSKGMVWTQDNMIDDAIAQVQRLIDLGARPENIGLEGMSLGGAVATLAAGKLHERKIKVKLYNERSFRTSTRLLSGYILPDANSNPWNPITWLKYLTAAVVYILLTPIMWLVGWYMDAASAWDKIPEEDKDFSVIRDRTASTPLLFQEDEVIHDRWASLASYVDEKRAQIIEKLQNGENLSKKEQKIFYDEEERHSFRVSKDEIEQQLKLPHHVPRRYLVNSMNNTEQLHDHMTSSFTLKFGNTPLDQNKKTANGVNISNTPPQKTRRPLFIANSGGTGHISAIMGIIDELKKDKKVQLQLTEHQAQLYQQKAFSWRGIILRSATYIMSIWGIGTVVAALARLLGYPRFPDWNEFQREIVRLEKAETAENSNPPQGKNRLYIDMLLDLYPIGYESAALMNTLHRMDKTTDINLLIQHKGESDKWFYKTAYNSFLTMLVDAVEKGEPYTEIVSTQPLAIDALCDAVHDYNQYYLRRKNSELKTPLPAIAIHQFLTDLPSIECEHFLDTLINLTPEQQNQMHVYGVDFSQGVIKTYLEDGKNFLGAHNLSPKSNPMIRAGFKDSNLSRYLDKSQQFSLNVKAYKQEGKDNWVAQEPIEEVVIPAHAKVASIMLGSLASDATVLYVKHLLESNQNFDKIFVFGGLNNSIYRPLEDIIKSYPVAQQESIRNRIVRLGNQSDTEIAPIMTRSDAVIIRGGGLCVMEQMALPLDLKKSYFFHHKNNPKGMEHRPLTSGLNWEDGNVSRLIEYFTAHKIPAKKISPNMAYEAFKTKLTEKPYNVWKDPILDRKRSSETTMVISQTVKNLNRTQSPPLSFFDVSTVPQEVRAKRQKTLIPTIVKAGV